MARYVVPVVVLLALVGGYVVGQQPGADGIDEDIGVINDLAPTLAVTAPELRPVGRYVPFPVGMLLDTTSGTLYVQEGNTGRWKAVVTMTGEPPADLERGTIELRPVDTSR
jgi:hypothetical protein